jgi:acetolactate synthase-1/2/3 large subunit
MSKQTGRNGAEALVATLKEYGVRHIFGLPGDTSIVLYEALRQERDSIQHILTRDERSASFMADAYARLSGRPGVCEAPSGGGATYLLPGVAEANHSFIPMLAFTTDIPVKSEGRGVLTEIDQVQLYSAATKWSNRVKRADLLPETVRKAFRLATGGRPGAVHLSLPEDVLEESCAAPVYAEPRSATCPAYRTRPDQESVAEVARLLKQANQPLIVAGGGVVTSGAFGPLQELAEMLAAPVATTITGKGSFAETHPLSVGVIGGNGGRLYAHDLLSQADLIFYIGTNLDSVATMGWTLPQTTAGKTIIQLEVEPGQIGHQYPLAAGLVCDAKLGLVDLIAECQRIGVVAPNPNRAQELAHLKQSWLEQARTLSEKAVELPAHPLQVIFGLQKALEAPEFSKREVVVLADPGTPTPYTASYYQLARAGRGVVIPRAFGGLGYVIPAVVGAALARPQSKIIGLCTDGGFGMSCGELETVHRLGQDILLINFNNGSFGWIKMLQHLYHERQYYSVDFSQDSGYAAVARGFGLEAIEVNDPRNLDGAIRQGLQTRGPVFIDVKTLAEPEETPPVAKWQADAARLSLNQL